MADTAQAAWSESDLLDLVLGLTQEAPFTERNNQYQEWRGLCERRRDVKIPNSTLQIKHQTPALADDAHAFKNRLLAAKIKINVAATGDGEEKRQAARNQEKFYYRHYYRWRDAGVFDRPLYDQASIGRGVTELALNPLALPVFPEFDGKDVSGYLEKSEASIKEFAEKEQGDLFILRAIDPATVYETPGGDIKVQAAVMPLRNIAAEYAKRGIKIGVQDGKVQIGEPSMGEDVNRSLTMWKESVTLYTVQTDDYCYHLLVAGEGAVTKDGGRLVAAYKNYFLRPTFFDLLGARTGSSHPLYMSDPLIAGKYAFAKQENLLGSAMLSAGLDASQQRYALKWIGPEGQEPQEPGALTITIGPDGVLQTPAGYEVYAPKLDVGFDLQKALEFVVAQMDRFGYPKGLNRPDEVTATSGYDRMKQMEAVESLLSPPLQNHASMITAIFRAMASAIKELGVPLTARNIHTRAGNVTVGEAVRIKPADIVDVDINVNFNSTTLSSTVTMAEEGAKLMQIDQMTETTFQEQVMGIDDMDEFRDQRATDKVMKNADDRAVAAVNSSIDKLAALVEEKALADAGIQPPEPPPPPADVLAPTTGESVRADRGPSIPIGVGQAMPITPTPPGMGETPL